MLYRYSNQVANVEKLMYVFCVIRARFWKQTVMTELVQSVCTCCIALEDFAHGFFFVRVSFKG